MYTLRSEYTTNSFVSSVTEPLFLLFISNQFLYFPSIPLCKRHKDSICVFSTFSPVLSPPVHLDLLAGGVALSFSSWRSATASTCSSAEFETVFSVRGSMKKVYSLVNITKAKDQEAVQSICIKVSLVLLLLLWKWCYSFKVNIF